MTHVASHPRVVRLRRLLTAAALALALAAPAAAASYTSSGAGNWDDPTTWGGAGVPTGSDSVSIGAHAIALNGANRACAALTFTGSGSITGANTLTLGGQLSATGSAAPTISCSTLAWGGSLAALANAASGAITISAAITGTAGLTKTGAGVVALSANNTGLSGTITVSAGTLRLSGANGSIVGGAALVVEAGGTFDIDSTSTSANRIADAATVTMKGGTFSWSTSGTVSETISVMAFAKGHSFVSFNAVTGSPTLTASNPVSRSNAATMELNRGASPYGFLKWTGTATGLTRWTVVEQGGSVQTGNYDTANGLVQLGTGTLFTSAGSNGTGNWVTPATWTNNSGFPGGGDHVMIGSGNKISLLSANAVTSFYVNNLSPANSAGTQSSNTLTINGNYYHRGDARGRAASLMTFGTNEAVFISTGTGANGDVVGWGDATTLTAGSVTVSGTSRIEFNRDNGMTGVFEIAGGTCRVGCNGALGTTGSGTTVYDGATLDIGNSGNDVIHPAGGVAYSSAEPLTLYGLGVGNAGALTNSGGNGSFAGPITLASNASMAAASATNFTLSGVVSGGFTLTKNGAGTLILSGANTYTGATTIASGTLSLTNAAGAGTTAGGVSVTGGACLDINGVAVGAEPVTLNGSGVASAGALTGTGNASLGGVVTLASNSSIGGVGSLTLANQITGAFSVTKVGAGTLTLSSGSSDYSGGTTLAAGTLVFGADSTGTPPTSGPIGTGTLTITGGSIAATAGGRAVYNPLIFAGDFAVVGDRYLQMWGDATLTGTRTITVTTAQASFPGVISGAFGLTKAGYGTFGLGGNSTYSGPTAINAGTLRVASTGLGSTAGATTVAAGAQIEPTGAIWGEPITLSGNGPAAGMAAFAAVSTVSWSGPVTLAGDSSFGGVGDILLSGAVGGGGFGITKVGPGLLDLQAGNTFTGASAINGGTVRVSGSALSDTGALTLASAAVDYPWVEDVSPWATLNEPGGGGVDEAWTWVTSSPAPFSGLAAHQSGITAGPHQSYFAFASDSIAIPAGAKFFAYVYLDPANPPTEVMLQFHEVTLGWEHRGYFGADAIPWGGASGTDAHRSIGALPATGSWVRLEIPASQVGMEGLILDGIAFSLNDGRATWDRTGVNANFSPRLDLNGASETVGSLAGGGVVTLGAGTLTCGGNNASTAYTGPISGTGGLTKNGTGTMTLSAACPYGGTTTVNGGILRLSGASLANSTVSLANAGGVALDVTAPTAIGGLAGGGAAGGNVTAGANALTCGGDNATTVFDGTITCSGGLTKTGSGTLTLSRACNGLLTGTTTINAGRLNVNAITASIAVAVAGGALGGSGTVGAITTSGAGSAIRPGIATHPGVLSASSANLSGGTAPTVAIRIFDCSTAGADYDKLALTGALTLGGTSVLDIDLSGFGGVVGTVDVITAASVTGTFATVNVTGGSATVSYTATAVRVNVTSTTLIAQYLCDDASGTRLSDSSGNGLHGALQTGCTWVADGHDGGAVRVPGGNISIELPTAAILQSPSIGVSMWIRRPLGVSWRGEGQEFLWTKGPDYLGPGWYCESWDGNWVSHNLGMWVDGTGGFPNGRYTGAMDPDTRFPQGEWCHVYYAFDTTSNLVTVLKDGVDPGANNLGSPDTITATLTPRLLGDCSAPCDFDLVRIYSNASAALGVRRAGEKRKLWDGGGSDDNWSTAANWSDDVAPLAGDELVFAGTTRLTPTNDYPANTSFRGIVFLDRGFTVGGNPVTLTGGGVGNRTGANTLSTPITLAAAQTFRADVASRLTIAGAIANGGYDLACQPYGTLRIAGAISGTGAVTKTGSGILDLASASGSYSGATTLAAGVLRASADVQASANGPFGNSAANVVLNGGELELASATFSRGVTANAAAIDAYGAARTMASTISETGGLTLGCATRISVASANDGNWRGVYGSEGYDLRGDATSLPAYVTVTNGGIPFTGFPSSSFRDLEVAAGGGGRVANCWYGASFTIDFAFNDGNPHQVAFYCLDNDDSGRAQTVTVTDIASGATLASDSISRFHDRGVWLVYRLSGTVDVTFTCTGGANALVMGYFFDPCAGWQLTASGAIGGSGGVTKVGGGTAVLSGANTWSGSTTVARGTLRCGATRTLPATWDTSLVGWWRLDETAVGDAVRDASGNGLTGAMAGIAGPAGPEKSDLPATAFGDPGACAFDGVDDHIAVNDPGVGSVLDASGALTLAAWIDPASIVGSRTIVVKGRTAGVEDSNYALRLESGGKLAFYYASSVNTFHIFTSSAVVAATGTWRHVAMTGTLGTPSSLKLYVDGVPVSGTWTLGTGALPPLVTDGALWIGATTLGSATPAELWDGLIDDVRIYQRELSAAEIASVAMSPPGAAGRDTLVASGATLDLAGYDQVVGALQGAGAVALGSGRLTCAPAADTTFPGVISGAGRIEKVGSSTLTLTGANTFTGHALVSGGTLTVGSAGALGGNGGYGSATAVGSAGTLRWDGTYDVGPEYVFATGAGYASLGSIYASSGGRPVIRGPITITGRTVLASDGVAPWVIGGGGPNSIGGTGSLVKRGAGGIGLYFGCNFTGSTTIDAGEVFLDGTNAALWDGAQGTSAITINGGGTLRIDGSVGADPDRIGDTVPITLNGGRLTLTAPATGRSETFGQLVIGPGASSISLNSGAGVGVLTASGDVSRGPGGGTLALDRGAGAPFGKLFFTGTADATVEPWSTVTQATTTTGVYTTANGLVQDAATVYRPVADGPWSTNTNWTPVGVPGANDDVIWADWRYVGGGTQSVRNLTVPNTGMFNQGGLIHVGGVIRYSTTWNFQGGHSMAIDFGANTGVIANTGTGIAFSHPTVTITGTAGLVKTGSGAYRNAGANTFTGTMTVAEGEWRIGHPGALSDTASGTIVRRDGVLTLDGVAVAGEPLTLDGPGQNSAGALAARGVASSGGPVTLTADAAIGTATAGSALTVSGAVSGAYGLTTAGRGLIRLSGASSYSGATTIAGAGTVRVEADVAAGAASPLGSAATVTLAGGAIEQDTAAFSRPIVLAADGGRVDAHGAGRILAAPISASGARAGLLGSYYAGSLRGIDEDDWRSSRQRAGTRLDPIIAFSSPAFGSAAERAAFGIGGNDTNWDGYSIQWDGWIVVRTAGTTLKTRSDDNSRVWIDLNGDGAINSGEWGSNGWSGPGQGVITRAVSNPLPVGTYRIRVQYEEGVGGNEIQLAWTDPAWSAGVDADGDYLVPSSCLVSTAQLQVGGTEGFGAGLVGTYYDANFTGPLSGVLENDWRLTRFPCGTRLDGPLAFLTDTWGTAAERIAFNIQDEGSGTWGAYAVQWDGWITVPVAGTDLLAGSDDGSRVWLDLNGDGVVDPAEWAGNGWGSAQPMTVVTTHPGVAAGTYRIRIQYVEAGGNNAFALLWSDAAHSAGTYAAGQYVVPASFLSAWSSGPGPGQPLDLGGAISGALDLRKVRTSAARLLVPESYTGDTLVEGGSLALAANDILPDTTRVAIASGASLALWGWNDSVAALTGLGTLATAGGTLTVVDGDAHTFSGAITGSGGIVKAGAGTMTLTGSSTCTGTTVVAAGTLVVDGSLASSPIRITGGTLAGNGIVGPITARAGTIAPGSTTQKGILRAGTGLPGGSAIGINLGSAAPAITIDGLLWRSNAAALAGGLTETNVTQAAYGFPQAITPTPDSDTALMLVTSAWRGTPPDGQGFRLDQAVANGAYDVSLWYGENAATGYRDIDLALEGTTITTGSAIAGIPLCTWRRYGPFRTTVSDGSLTVDILRRSKGDPMISGLLIEPVTAPGTITTSRIGTGATVRLRIAAYGAPGVDYDRLSFGGHAVDISGSTLQLDLSGLTTAGTAAGVLQFGSCTGRFANVTLLNNASGLQADLIYNAGSIDVALTGPANLVAWYKLDETAGTFVADSSGNYHHGTRTGGSWDPAGGAIGGAESRGDGDEIDIPDHNDFEFASGQSITITAWVKPTGVSASFYSAVLVKGFWNPFGLYLGDGNPADHQISFYYQGTGGTSGYKTSGAPVVYGVWQHIAFRYTFGQANTAKLYWNGAGVIGGAAWNGANVGNDPPIAGDNGVVKLGNELGNASPFLGEIDDVRVYRRYLGDDEILALYDCGRTTRTWDGGGGNDSWTTAQDWVGDGAPNPGDDLVFAGATRLTPSNTFAATTFRSLAFSAGGFTLGGNALTLTDGISNAVGSNTLALGLTLSRAQTIATASGATTTTTAAGTIANGGSRLLVDGAGTTALGGVISGGGGLTKLGGGSATLSANNTYTGSTIVSDGTLIVTGSQPASAVSLVAGLLRGTGTVGAITGASGTTAEIRPSSVGAVGSLKAASADLSGGVTLRVRIPAFGAAGVAYDQLDCTGGSLTLGAGSHLVVDLAGLATTGTATSAIVFSAPVVGMFDRVEAVNNPNRWIIEVAYDTAGRIDIGVRQQRRGIVGVGAPHGF